MQFGRETSTGGFSGDTAGVQLRLDVEGVDTEEEVRFFFAASSPLLSISPPIKRRQKPSPLPLVCLVKQGQSFSLHMPLLFVQFPVPELVDEL